MYQLKIKLFHKSGALIAVWTESFSSEADRECARVTDVGTTYADGSYLQVLCI